MPYGIPPSKGGESAENVAKMERCVEAVKREHPDWDDSRCIAICKVSLGFTKSFEMLAVAYGLRKAITFEAETERIKENKKTPEAQKPHPFKEAHWTHPNGHPRCLICGDEERLDLERIEREHIDLMKVPVEEWPTAPCDGLAAVEKFNQSHDAQGRFASGSGGGGGIAGTSTGDGLDYRTPSYMRHFFKRDTVEARMTELNSHEGETVMLTRKAGMKGPAWGPDTLHRNDATSVKIGKDVVQAMDVADVAVYAPVAKEVQALEWALEKFNPYHDTRGRFSGRGIGRVAPGVSTHPAMSGTMIMTDEDLRRQEKPLNVSGAITTLHMDLEEAGFKQRSEGDYVNDFSERITMKEVPGTVDLAAGARREALAVSMYHHVSDSMPFSSEHIETQQQFEFSNVRTRLLIERMTLSGMEKRALFRAFLKFNHAHDQLGRFTSGGGIAGSSTYLPKGPTHHGHMVNPEGWASSGGAVMPELQKPGGGFSMRPTEEHPTHGEGPKDGFMVSEAGTEESFPASQLSTMKVASYMARHAQELRDPSKYFGGWHDAKTGKVYLDISKNYRTQGEAVAVAKTNRQVAFYDVVAKKTIYLKELLASRPTKKAVDSEPRKIYLPKDDPEEAFRLLEALVGESTEKAD